MQKKSFLRLATICFAVMLLVVFMPAPKVSASGASGGPTLWCNPEPLFEPTYLDYSAGYALLADPPTYLNLAASALQVTVSFAEAANLVGYLGKGNYLGAGMTTTSFDRINTGGWYAIDYGWSYVVYINDSGGPYINMECWQLGEYTGQSTCLLTEGYYNPSISISDDITLTMQWDGASVIFSVQDGSLNEIVYTFTTSSRMAQYFEVGSIGNGIPVVGGLLPTVKYFQFVGAWSPCADPGTNLDWTTYLSNPQFMLTGETTWTEVWIAYTTTGTDSALDNGWSWGWIPGFDDIYVTGGYDTDMFGVINDLYVGFTHYANQQIYSGNGACLWDIPPVNLQISIGSGSGSINPSAGSYSYNFSTCVTVSANPATGYWFNHWLLVLNGEGNLPTESWECASLDWSFCMNASYSLTAYFTPNPTLTISVSGSGSTTPSGTFSCCHGSTVTVTEIPSSGYAFAYWLLDSTTYYYTTSITVTMGHHSHSLTAYFVVYYPTLNISASSGGTTIPIPGQYSESYGSSVNVTANPYPNYAFQYWLLDQVVNINNPITVDMTADHSLTAYFNYVGGGGGGDGCPYVYDWNGSAYVKDNNILPASETGNGTDTKDYCLLQLQLVPVFTAKKESVYSLQIGEFESEIDYIDQVKLMAVDHSQGTNVAVTPEGQILTYTNPASPISAIDNNGVSQLSEIATMNGNVSDPSTYFQGNTGDWLLLDLGKVTGPYANLILRDDMNCEKICLDVQVLNASGDWQTVETLHPRAYWSIEAANMAAYLPKTGDFKVRLYWTTPHRFDYVGLDTSPPAPVQVNSAPPTLAIHSTMGDVTQKLLYDDEQCVKLVNGQHITLWFTLPSQAQGTTRSFILYTDGYYYTITP